MKLFYLFLTASLVATFPSVEAAESPPNINYLLQTNALNYQDNHEVDTDILGHCVAGTPESNLKADAQTTRNDAKCQALVRQHDITFATKYIFAPTCFLITSIVYVTHRDPVTLALPKLANG